MKPDKIKVLIVDDSAVTRSLLIELLSSDPQLEVVAALEDGRAAVEFVRDADPIPDVLVMDMHMPHLDGFEATRRIMESRPLPIVICTATANANEVAVVFRAMEAGAVACVEKPVGTGPDFESLRHNLLQSVRLMSEVRVVRRWNRVRSGSPIPAANGRIDMVGIGASTGGPPVLQMLLSQLPKDLPVPLLIVQHIARGFLPGMVQWLNETTGWRVQVASHRTVPLPGHAYVAPDDFHLAVDARGHLILARDVQENGLRPAVSYLFRSLADFCGPRAVGILLTGMGRDGARELGLMKERGAYTIAQDRASSVVHGMAGEAISLGAATAVLAADQIAPALLAHVRRTPHALTGGAER